MSLPPSPTSPLATPVAVVSGGAAMIGAAIARALHRDGYHVVVADIDDTRGTAAARALTDRSEFIRLDVTDDQSITTFAQTLGARFGRIDALVNNAVSYADDGLMSDRATWQQALAVNLIGPALLIAALRPLLAASGRAAVVNLGSVGGKVGARGRLLYPSSKAAALQMTRTLAVDLAAEHIRVNAVSPGWTWSDAMIRMSDNDRALADAAAADVVPLARVGDPADVADAVAFLCSDAARYITGADLAVDGGFTASGPDQGSGPRPWFARARQVRDAESTSAASASAESASAESTSAASASAASASAASAPAATPIAGPTEPHA